MPSPQALSKSNLKDYCFRTSIKMARSYARSNKPDNWQNRFFLSSLVVTDAVQILPRFVLGPEMSWPHEALRPSSMTCSQRGAVGCVFFAAAKSIQFGVAFIGAALGFSGSVIGSFVGLRTDDWMDIAAGKGWQLGTIAGTVIISVSELIRYVSIGLGRTLESSIGAVGGSIGNLLDQLENTITVRVPYSEAR